MCEFIIGDLVRMKFGGGTMVVNGIDNGAGHLECIWFTNNAEIQFLYTAQYMLEPAPNIPQLTYKPARFEYRQEAVESKNPHYDEGADLDQQSQEFWDWF